MGKAKGKHVTLLCDGDITTSVSEIISGVIPNVIKTIRQRQLQFVEQGRTWCLGNSTTRHTKHQPLCYVEHRVASGIDLIPKAAFTCPFPCSSSLCSQVTLGMSTLETAHRASMLSSPQPITLPHPVNQHRVAGFPGGMASGNCEHSEGDGYLSTFFVLTSPVIRHLQGFGCQSSAMCDIHPVLAQLGSAAESPPTSYLP
ncbi:hypothetical protein UY3_15397 [Chelonia mydas]|uniref:Uncharacterized protein n=1 Tax=Chelonia mydas TaxID=8469 RepID=M7B5R0_CHEMY|nr:hypothetical protein UY3_15397 [Chelonia mydas]